MKLFDTDVLPFEFEREAHGFLRTQGYVQLLPNHGRRYMRSNADAVYVIVPVHLGWAVEREEVAAQ